MRSCRFRFCADKVWNLRGRTSAVRATIPCAICSAWKIKRSSRVQFSSRGDAARSRRMCASRRTCRPALHGCVAPFELSSGPAPSPHVRMGDLNIVDCKQGNKVKSARLTPFLETCAATSSGTTCPRGYPLRIAPRCAGFPGAPAECATAKRVIERGRHARTPRGQPARARWSLSVPPRLETHAFLLWN